MGCTSHRKTSELEIMHLLNRRNADDWSIKRALDRFEGYMRVIGNWEKPVKVCIQVHSRVYYVLRLSSG